MRFCSGCKKWVNMTGGCFDPKTSKMYCEECTIKMDEEQKICECDL